MSHFDISKDGIQQFAPYIDKIRQFINFFNSFGACIQDFTNMYQHIQLKPNKFLSDVQHMWNSLYHLLDVVLPYRAIIDCYYNQRSNEPSLNELDWTIVEYFYNFLKVLYKVTNHFSGVYYPTFPHALSLTHEIFDQFKKHRNVDLLQQIITFMKKKFKKY